MPNMNRRSLPQDSIDQIKRAGYRVYMRDRADSWALYVDENRIGYVQYDPAAGFTVSTVHKPNPYCGTGFQIARHVTALDSDMLHVGATFGGWGRDNYVPIKYQGIDQYRAESTFGPDMHEV